MGFTSKRDSLCATRASWVLFALILLLLLGFLCWKQTNVFAEDNDVTLASNSTIYDYPDIPSQYSVPDVYYWVLINKEWRLVNSDGTLFEGDNTSDYVAKKAQHLDDHWGNHSYGFFFMSGKEIEDVYGPLFGFSSRDLIGTVPTYPLQGARASVRIFANVPSSEFSQGLIWADESSWYSGEDYYGVPNFQDASAWRIPVMNTTDKFKDSSAQLFYLPKNANYTSTSDYSSWEKPESYFERNKNMNNEKLKEDNTFYSIETVDDLHLVYSKDEIKNIHSSYVLSGNAASIKLKKPSSDDVHWVVFDVDGNEIADGVSYVDNGDGTVTATILNVESQLTFNPLTKVLAKLQSTTMRHWWNLT